MAGGRNGWSADAGGTFRYWTAIGALGDAQYIYQLGEATSPGASVSPAVTLKDGIRSEVPSGKNATNFSALTHRNGVDFMTFSNAEGASCVGIRRYGPSMGEEYQWILNAVRCKPQGLGVSTQEIDDFIAGAAVR